MSVTLDTSHLEMSPLNDDALKNISPMLVTLDTSQLEMSPSKDDAGLNIRNISVTLDTSQLDMSPLNSLALLMRFIFLSMNSAVMSVTPETSQDPIRPWGPFLQERDRSRHSAMAAWSSALDCGAQSLESAKDHVNIIRTIDIGRHK